MTVAIILDSLFENCSVADSFLSFVLDWLWILSVSLQLLFNRWMFLLIAGSKLNNSSTKWQSPLQHFKYKSFFLRKMTSSSASVLTIWSHSFLFCLLISLTLSFILSLTLAQSRVPLLPRISSFTLPLSTPSIRDTTPCGVLTPTTGALSFWYSPPQQANGSVRVPRKEWPVPQLTGVYGMVRVPRKEWPVPQLTGVYGMVRSDQSRSSQGYMAWCGCHERSDQSRSSQGYMAWCGCHEILTRRSVTILLLSNSFDFPSGASEFSLLLYANVECDSYWFVVVQK